MVSHKLYGSTELRMGLALLTSRRGSGDSSPVHQSFMSSQSPEKPRFGIDVLRVPHSLSKRTRPNPYFHVVRVPLVDLAPQANLSPQHILLVLVIGNVSGNVLIMQVKPCNVIPVIHTKIVSHSHVQVKRSIIRDDNWVFGLRVSSSPPVNNVAFFDLNLTVHPVHGCLFGVKVLNDLVLFSSVVSFNLMFLDFLQFDKVSSVFETSQHDFITSQVNDWVRENINNLSKDFFDQFVGFVQSHVQRPHIPTAKSACDVLVLRGKSPTCSVPRCIQLWHHSYTSHHRVSY